MSIKDKELTTEKLGADIIECLDAISERVKINKQVFILYYDLFREYENHPMVMSYLAQAKDIDIETIKNTKLLVHLVIFNFIVRYSRERDKKDIWKLFENNTDEFNLLIDEIVNYAISQDTILKLPTLEERRAEEESKK